MTNCPPLSRLNQPPMCVCAQRINCYIASFAFPREARTRHRAPICTVHGGFLTVDTFFASLGSLHITRLLTMVSGIVKINMARPACSNSGTTSL